MKKVKFEIVKWNWLDDPKANTYPHADVTVIRTTTYWFGLMTEEWKESLRGYSHSWRYVETAEKIGLFDPIEDFLEREYTKRIWDIKGPSNR
jgi:hypothetical protein